LRLLVEVAQAFLHVAVAPGVAGVEGREEGLELLVEVLELVHRGAECHGRQSSGNRLDTTSAAADVARRGALGQETPMPSGPRAVIFDVDGVLVDSYHAHLESWVLMAREHGLHLTEQEFASTFGQTSREIIGRFWGPELSAADRTALDARKEAIYRDLIRARFPAMDGAVEL